MNTGARHGHKFFLRSIDRRPAGRRDVRAGRSRFRADLQGIRWVDRWFYPPAAVREAIINAFVHADYAQQGAPVRVSIFDDQIEIENPGILPFGLTLDDIRRGVSKLRNRVIGRVFLELCLIEQYICSTL